jgi:hypothetical protein
MRDATPKEGTIVAVRPPYSRRLRWRVAARCSVCTCRIWFNPICVMEPEMVPEPRLSWTLCKGCYQALLTELRQSPVSSALRLRIAIGLVASERWPQAYSTRMRNYIYDRRWIVFMAAGFFIAMILHLVIIVMVASAR